jgi:hypothetical protein
LEGFETEIPASSLQQTPVLDRAATALDKANTRPGNVASVSNWRKSLDIRNTRNEKKKKKTHIFFQESQNNKDIIAKATSCSAYSYVTKPAVLQPVKKFPSFYGILRSITAFTRTRHLSLSWATSIQSTPPLHFFKINFNIILFSTPRFIQVVYSLRVSPSKTLHATLPHTWAKQICTKTNPTFGWLLMAASATVTSYVTERDSILWLARKSKQKYYGYEMTNSKTDSTCSTYVMRQQRTNTYMENHKVENTITELRDRRG